MQISYSLYYLSSLDRDVCATSGCAYYFALNNHLGRAQKTNRGTKEQTQVSQVQSHDKGRGWEERLKKSSSSEKTMGNRGSLLCWLLGV